MEIYIVILNVQFISNLFQISDENKTIISYI